MVDPLWSWRALVAATRGRPEGTAAGGISGISIDTRTLAPGDLFVALRGDAQDGHVYVSKAFEKGAAAALEADDFVTPKGAGPLIRVGDPERDPALAALERLGVAARKRLSSDARVIAVTGSVGKTSTKDMLRKCLAAVGPTHGAEKSYNNHWGVPLTLARMPASTKYGVFEIGMNHAGEITPLTKMVRPHVAIVTTVGPVHLEFFPREQAIADAKAEIFAGLEPKGTAVLPADNKHFRRLKDAAERAGAVIDTFGGPRQEPHTRWQYLEGSIGPADQPQTIKAQGPRGLFSYQLGAHGVHQAENSLAVLAAIDAAGVPLSSCIGELKDFSSGAGRGQMEEFRTAGGLIRLLDESYNANPLSMAAALQSHFMASSVGHASRRVAVLGDMRELGDTSRQLHAALLQPITAAQIDLVFACGPHMAALYDALPAPQRGAYAERSEELIQSLLDVVRPGDVIMIKGSLGTRMAPIVEALKAELTKRATTT